MFIDEKAKEELKNIFSVLGDKKVKIIFFKENIMCQNCEAVESLLNDVKELCQNFELEIYNRITDESKAKEYNVERTPAIFVETDKTGKRVVFYGSPFGYEFISFIEAIKNSVAESIDLEEETKNSLKTVSSPVNIKVFVTPTCPYCPSAVVMAHKFAIFNENIRAEMIEIHQYPDLATKYSVEGVPKIVINEKVEMVGAQPEYLMVEGILKSINSTKAN